MCSSDLNCSLSGFASMRSRHEGSVNSEQKCTGVTCMSNNAPRHCDRASNDILKSPTLCREGSKTHDSLVEEKLPSLSSKDVMHLSNSLQALIDLAVLYGFDSSKFSRTKTLCHWQKCSAQCDWIKFLKYKLSSFMAFFLDNELPDKPFQEEDKPNMLACGSLGRFFLKIVRGRLSYSLRCSVLKLKKGFDRPDSDYVRNAVQEAKLMLTTEHPGPASEWISRERVFYEARRTVREIFKKKITQQDLEHPYAPSVKANYVDSRSEFGTFGTLIEKGLLLDIDTPSHVYQNALVEAEESRVHSEVPDYRLNPRLKVGVEKLYSSCYRASRELAKNEVADVKLVGLAEALKVRTISKGPPLTYFVLKPVQKFLHNQMRKLSIFVALDRPIEERDITRMFCHSTGEFISLDYKSATDLLDPEYSRVIMNEICDTVDMPEDIRELCIKALTGHLIEGVPQKWGQLMGSIVSFIVLCVANAAIVRACLEISDKCIYPISHKNSFGLAEQCPILINGDDGLVRSSGRFYMIWKSVAASVGLVPSIGKTYAHREYCNINSTSFLFRNNEAKLIPDVNMGLVLGLGRSSSISSKDVFDPDSGLTIGARHRELIKSCPFELRLAVHELFLRRNSSVLTSLRAIPWYVSESLGGVGLAPIYDIIGEVDEAVLVFKTLPSGHTCGPSDTDLALVRDLRNYKGGVTVGKVPTNQPIQARPVWSSVVRSHYGQYGKVELDSRTETFLDLSTYLTSPSAVTAKIDASHRLEVLRRNERVWSSLYRNQSSFTPCRSYTAIDYGTMRALAKDVGLISV